MLQCLLPCLTPDHDFEQLVYAPWMRCFVLSMEKFISSSKEKAFAPNMQPHIELAGETCFLYFPHPTCLAEYGLTQHVSEETILQSCACIVNVQRCHSCHQ